MSANSCEEHLHRGVGDEKMVAVSDAAIDAFQLPRLAVAWKKVGANGV